MKIRDLHLRYVQPTFAIILYQGRNVLQYPVHYTGWDDHALGSIVQHVMLGGLDRPRNLADGVQRPGHFGQRREALYIGPGTLLEREGAGP